MRAKKQHTEPESRHTMKHIERELRNAYPLPDDMPRRLRTLVEHLEREITRAENHQGKKDDKQPGLNPRRSSLVQGGSDVVQKATTKLARQ
jgi:phage terminase Nu1 subunit (DNA packaging protein)